MDVDKMRQVLIDKHYGTSEPESPYDVVPLENFGDVEYEHLDGMEEPDIDYGIPGIMMEDYEMQDSDVQDPADISGEYVMNSEGVLVKAGTPLPAENVTPDEEPQLWDENTQEVYDFNHSKIVANFHKSTIKFLMAFATSYDYTDNNEKGEIVSWVIRHYEDGFEELGTGTNRIAFLNGRYVFKIALDRRGLIDNITEYQMSPRDEVLLAMTYETNFIVGVQEYCSTISKEDFTTSAEELRRGLLRLSRNFILGDMGITPKNFCNMGISTDGHIKFLDYAYMHKKFGNREALICPACGRGQITPNSDFSFYICTDCRTKWNYMDIKRRLNADMSNAEAMFISKIRNLEGFENPAMSDVADGYVDDVVKIARVGIWIENNCQGVAESDVYDRWQAYKKEYIDKYGAKRFMRNYNDSWIIQ